ncbi:MAG: metallopeptidase family protein [Acidobacteriota bacterium]
MHDHDEDEEDAGYTEEDVRKIQEDYEAAKSSEERYDLALALGDIWLGDDAEAALSWYEKAHEEMPDDPEALSGQAEALFEMWEIADAETACRDALEKHGADSRAHYVLAMIQERRGKEADAMRHYKVASKEDPERFFVPPRLTRHAFESAAKDAMREIPGEVLQLLKDTTIVIEDLPSDARIEDFQREGLSPTLLGLFEGTPPLERSHDAPPALPPRITLFQRNVERVSPDRETLVDEIARTVLHEIGHCAGLDEDDLEDAGYE